MDEFESISRSAVNHQSQKPFIEWVKYVDSEAQYLDDKHDSKAVYLLPEVSDTGKSECTRDRVERGSHSRPQLYFPKQISR